MLPFYYATYDVDLPKTLLDYSELDEITLDFLMIYDNFWS